MYVVGAQIYLIFNKNLYQIIIKFIVCVENLQYQMKL